MEAIKILAGHGTSLAGRMLHYDATTARMREISLKPDPSCALCGKSSSITEPLACDSSSSGPGQPKEMSVPSARAILEKGFEGILLDVRERDEYVWAHIEGSQLAPLSEFGQHLETLPRGIPYLVYCKMGQRSAHAARILMEAGFADVTNLQGGIMAWLDDKAPVIRE